MSGLPTITSSVLVDGQLRLATARTWVSPMIPTRTSSWRTGSAGITVPSRTPAANVSSVSWGEIVERPSSIASPTLIPWRRSSRTSQRSTERADATRNQPTSPTMIPVGVSPTRMIRRPAIWVTRPAYRPTTPAAFVPARWLPVRAHAAALTSRAPSSGNAGTTLMPARSTSSTPTMTNTSAIGAAHVPRASEATARPIRARPMMRLVSGPAIATAASVRGVLATSSMGVEPTKWMIRTRPVAPSRRATTACPSSWAMTVKRNPSEPMSPIAQVMPGATSGWNSVSRLATVTVTIATTNSHETCNRISNPAIRAIGTPFIGRLRHRHGSSVRVG